jgi:hypothetical protein
MKTNTSLPTATKPSFLTPAALRERWAVSNMFLWRARRDGKLKSVKLGKHVRYRVTDVEQYEAKRLIG